MNKDNVRSVFWWLLNVALIVVILVGISLSGVLRNAVSSARTITVSAEGKANVAPNIATIMFGVVSEGKDPKVLQEENVKKVNDAIAFVKAQGIDAKDIQTQQFSLNPRYRWIPDDGRQLFDGYTLRQSVVVKVRDFEKVNAILAGLAGFGINEISGPNFQVEDPDQYLNEAREEAFRKARAKVDAMARQNGVRVRRVVTFSEGSGGYPIYYDRAVAMEAGKGGDMPPMPTIEPGQEEVTVQVSVTYEIR